MSRFSQEVRRAPVALDLVRRSLDRRPVRDVDAEPLCREIENHDTRAALLERADDCPAELPCAAGDDGDAAFERAGHRQPP